MLPGIRILFATFVLSASVLIFGLGAAALLRSAHEEFVGIPAWRAAQQPMAPAIDTGRSTLALVRVDPPPPNAERKIESPSNGEIEPQNDKLSVETKTASIDATATEKTVVTEKAVTEDIAKPDEVVRPRLRKAKRTRTAARRGQTIRHWSAGTQTIQQPAATSFSGFEASDATGSSGTGSSGTGRNRRAASSSPF